ncbi:MAG TPA: DegT/DnrJ/EryC1/StrS family aminotransferase [Silvibacterium sp.]|nr:DegT/DnrJ/EryC1/StrS family aminotransferase [Silvibacterium sp.]
MNNQIDVPFLDLITPHVELEEELLHVVRTALHSAAFIGGAAVTDLERDFAKFCETEHAVGLASGTDALRFALLACGVQSGDVVITVPNTFIATTEAISQAGASPEFVDVDERTYNMDPGKLKEYLETRCGRDEQGRLISKRSARPVRAIVPVHLYGQMADMDAILNLAERFQLAVVEDACQAHGAEYFSQKHNRWFKAGSMGRAGAFSFYPGKNLGACGEAGAITTHDGELARIVKMLRDHGQAKKYFHDLEGYNGRLDAIQAGFLHVKLPHLSKWNAQRREHAARYNRRFAANKAQITCPHEPSWSRGVYHLYVVRTEDRDGMMNHLKQMGIGTAIHYPIPLHLQKAYASMNYREGEFPVAERVSKEIVSLPMFPQLTPEQQAHVVEGILSFAAAPVM